MTAMLAGKAPTIYGDGTQSRDFTYIEHIIYGNLLACSADRERVAGQVINLAFGDSNFLLDLVDVLNELLYTSINPTFTPTRNGDVKRSRVAIGKVQL